MPKSKKAFTLIELLVVIAIIGLLATISVIALNNARAKARDAKRVADVKQVQTALELFFNDKGRYPTADEFNFGSLSSTSTSGTTTYMAIIPAAANPPDGSCSTSTNPFGYSASNDGTSYTLSFCLGGQTGSLASGPKCATPVGVLNVNCTPFNPAALSGLQLWLKADAGVTKDSNDFVSAWANQSGHGHDVLQPSSSYQPQWISGQLNGKSILRFDGDYLQADPFTLDQPETVFLVVKFNNSSGWVFEGNAQWTMGLQRIADGLEINCENWGPQIAAVPIGNFYLISTYYKYADSYVQKNDDSPAIGPPPGVISAGGFILGSDNVNATVQMDVAEVLIYNTTLSSSDTAAVKQYLNKKYNLY